MVKEVYPRLYFRWNTICLEVKCKDSFDYWRKVKFVLLELAEKNPEHVSNNEFFPEQNIDTWGQQKDNQWSFFPLFKYSKVE